MVNCKHCGKPVTSGVVLHKECFVMMQGEKWIPVTERLPEPFVSVLAYVPSEAPLPLVHESYIADHERWVCILEGQFWQAGAVTHWMPMPEAPEVPSGRAESPAPTSRAHYEGTKECPKPTKGE